MMCKGQQGQVNGCVPSINREKFEGIGAKYISLKERPENSKKKVHN